MITTHNYLWLNKVTWVFFRRGGRSITTPDHGLGQKTGVASPPIGCHRWDVQDNQYGSRCLDTATQEEPAILEPLNELNNLHIRPLQSDRCFWSLNPWSFRPRG